MDGPSTDEGFIKEDYRIPRGAILFCPLSLIPIRHPDCRFFAIVIDYYGCYSMMNNINGNELGVYIGKRDNSFRQVIAYHYGQEHQLRAKADTITQLIRASQRRQHYL